MEAHIKNETFMNNLKYLKLIALMLVVLGHSTDIYKGDWVLTSLHESIFYKWISLYVNSIHMQIFVFVSGAVYAYCRIEKKHYRSYVELLKSKLKRLIIPYIFIGALFMIPIEIKAGVSTYNLGYIYSVKNLILGYESGHLWFLMMLFVLFLLYYLLEKIIVRLNFKIIIIFLFCIQMFYSRLPRIFLVNKAIYYMFFFYLGYLIYLNLGSIIKIEGMISKHKVIFLFLGLIIIPILIKLRDNLPQIKIVISIFYNLISDLIALIGIIQMYSVVLTVKSLKLYSGIGKCFDYIDRFNFSIYLLHEPIIFLILIKVINLNPSSLVMSCFLISIIISIIMAEIYYLIKAQLRCLLTRKLT
ncbi:acyltransferase family protein [Clostridium beijerinckii]|uniref:Fucose 4-O-acetylase-like acetyltransferase n=1 Tax=Clostridium beijerinckii TaxID=1520 RepID=A0AAE5H9P7_CLOBE|nr:acyltransferase [Clostridium beijerinckii]NSB16553.1 fucose 4-O-acetylase-like acetyltransferase [Clostridium beijerinckii]OOM23617.1 acyltransferase family protein [Clostridium beijerinckii]